MVKAFLLSSGFSSETIYNKISSFVKEREYAKCVIVVTPHPKKENSPWAEITKQQLEKMNLSVSFIDFDKGDGIDNDVDVIYVCGGNTFHLLHSIQQSKHDIFSQINDLFNRGGLYIGSSAGAVLCSHSIVSAGEIHPGDKNIDGIKDMTGLCITKHHIIPHYTEDQEDQVKEFTEKYGEVYRLRDGEALYINGDKEIHIK